MHAAFGVTRDNIADVKVIVQTDNFYLSIPCQPLLMFVLRVIISLIFLFLSRISTLTK